MKWEKVKLSDVSQIGDGAHASLKRVESGIPYLTAKNITKSGIDYSTLNYISEETYQKHFKESSNALTCPKENDILYSIIGSIGGVYRVQNEVLGISSSVAIFRPKQELVLSDYLTYYLKSSFFDVQVNAIKGGVAQGFLSLSKLGSISITIPNSIEYQQKIVDILSAYDDLIENNQKQIKLLEEAAQRLYKEWFVDLRFPGHEHTAIVDGVPEGWEKGRIEDIVLYYDSIRKPLSAIERMNFKGKYKYYGAAGVLDYVKEYLFDGKYLLLGEDGTVIQNDGTPVLQFVNEQFWVNNHAHVIIGKEPFTTEYLYSMFKNMKVNDVVTGVAQPKISQA